MTDPTSPPPVPRDPTSPLPASPWPATDPWPAADGWPEPATPPGTDPGSTAADAAPPAAAGGAAGGSAAAVPDPTPSDAGLIEPPGTWEPPTMPATWAGEAPVGPVVETTRTMPGTAGAPGPPDDEPVVAYLGEIAVTSTTVYTPAGPIPLRGSQWTVTDQWIPQQRTPVWAILAAIIGFCFLFLFSLLFLLARETVYHGTVQVMVTNGRQQYVARIPVSNQAQVQHLHQQANYVRSLAAL